NPRAVHELEVREIDDDASRVWSDDLLERLADRFCVGDVDLTGQAHHGITGVLAGGLCGSQCEAFVGYVCHWIPKIAVSSGAPPAAIGSKRPSRSSSRESTPRDASRRRAIPTSGCSRRRSYKPSVKPTSVAPGGRSASTAVYAAPFTPIGGPTIVARKSLASRVTTSGLGCPALATVTRCRAPSTVP